MKVTIHAPDPIVFVPPVLLEFGPERTELSGENATVLVYLDNVRATVTDLLSDPPLRAQVTIEHDSGEQAGGVLQEVVLADQAVLRVET